jgi:hypothetical protein
MASPPSSSSSACPPGEVPFRLLILEMGTGYDQHGLGLCPYNPHNAGWFLMDDNGSRYDEVWNLEKNGFGNLTNCGGRGECRQDVTAAAVRACKDAICSNSIPAFSTGTLTPITFCTTFSES